MMWVVFVQCLCVCWYKVSWRAHTDNFFIFFKFSLWDRLHIIRRARTASARRRPRATGCRRGLIGWEDESHQALHINCWVIADTEIISSRSEAGGRLQETCYLTQSVEPSPGRWVEQSHIPHVFRGKCPWLSFRKGRAFILKGKKQLVKSWCSCSLTM